MGSSSDPSAIRAAHALAAASPGVLAKSLSFRMLPPGTQSAILRDLTTIRRSFDPAASGVAMGTDAPLAEGLVARRPMFGTADAPATTGNGGAGPDGAQATPAPRKAATETIAARAGALIDEVDFPAFVAGLVHGTFDAMVDASIRQMEAYADLVAAVAKNADDFTRDNVSRGQAIDWLSERYPKDLTRQVPYDGSGAAQLIARAAGEDEEPRQPEWLADLGFEPQELSPEFIEEELIPAARKRIGGERMQTLATMVLLGMNRIIVRDGSISAKVRFRVAAADRAKLAYASGQDPGSQGWGERGSLTYAAPQTMISTVGANVQSDSDLKLELFGEVKINFASETLPLERFADSAQVALLQGHSRRPRGGAGSKPPHETAGAGAAPPSESPPARTGTGATP